MPVQTGKSGLMAKLGAKLRAAHEQHKGEQTVIGGNMNLPPGIDNGIAQLVECKFTQIAEGKQNAGEWMLYAAGVVKSPEKAPNGETVRGRHTKFSEALYDTPTRTRKTVSDHLGHIYAMFRSFGIDTENMEEDALEATAAALKEAKPHFKFRTWQGDPQVSKEVNGKWYVFQGKKQLAGPFATLDALKAKNPYVDKPAQTNEQWGGQVEYTDDDTAGSGVEDSTGNTEPSSNGDGGDKEVAEVTTEEGEESTDGDPFDLASLVEMAENNNTQAQKQLQDAALKAGMTKAEYSKASWQEVADYIEKAANAENEPEEVTDEEPEKFVPEIGTSYHYTPIDPATKKPVMVKGKPKVIEVEVLSVDEDKGTTSVRDMTTKTTYKGVRFSSLKVY